MTSERALIERLRGAVYGVEDGSEYEALLTEAANTLEAALSNREAASKLEAIANQLVDQSDEPWVSGTAVDRLHYWRDKAIHAAAAIRNLGKER
jgi:hypothetical protein